MCYVNELTFVCVFQTEIAKRLNAIIAQILPFLSQEHQQQVASAVERAKQVTMTELNAIIGVSASLLFLFQLPTVHVTFHVCDQRKQFDYIFLKL